MTDFTGLLAAPSIPISLRKPTLLSLQAVSDSHVTRKVDDLQVPPGSW